MRIPDNAVYLQNDKLARVFRLPNGDVRTYGKRVGSDCPLSYNERRCYVDNNGSPLMLCKFLMEKRGITLSEAWVLVKEARGFDTLRAHRLSLAQQGYRVEGMQSYRLSLLR